MYLFLIIRFIWKVRTEKRTTDLQVLLKNKETGQSKWFNLPISNLDLMCEFNLNDEDELETLDIMVHDYDGFPDDFIVQGPNVIDNLNDFYKFNNLQKHVKKKKDGFKLWKIYKFY